MNKLIKFLLAGVLFSSILVLSACEHQVVEPAQPTVYRPLTSREGQLIRKIKARGVKVIRIGDILRLVLPTDRFFRAQTTQLLANQHKTVQQVADLVVLYSKRYHRPAIRVYGYTDTVFDHKDRLKLSSDYAHVIAAYIWQRGIPQKRIVVKGLGAAHAIASNQYPMGSAYNRRVVVEVY